MKKSIKRSLIVVGLLCVATAGGAGAYRFKSHWPFKQSVATSGHDRQFGAPAQLGDNNLPLADYGAGLWSNDGAAGSWKNAGSQRPSEEPNSWAAHSSPQPGAEDKGARHEGEAAGGDNAASAGGQTEQSGNASLLALGPAYRDLYMADLKGGSHGSGAGSPQSGGSSQSTTNTQSTHNSDSSSQKDESGALPDSSTNLKDTGNEGDHHQDGHHDEHSGGTGNGDGPHFEPPATPTHSVPEPDMLLLFGSGLAAMRWASRRKR